MVLGSPVGSPLTVYTARKGSSGSIEREDEAVRGERRGRGDGSVFYDESKGRWVAVAESSRHPATGRRVRVKRFGKTKTEATRRLKEAVKEAEGVAQQTGPRRVDHLLVAWVAAGAPSRRRKGEAGLAMARSLTDRHLRPALGHHPINGLTPEHIEKMLEAKAAAGLSKATVGRLRATLAQAYDWAVGRRSATWNPARVAMMPDVEHTPARVGRALDAAESAALLEAADDHRLGAWVVVTLTLALRPGETSGLTWPDLDLDQGVAVIHRALAWTNNTNPRLKGTKTGTTRTIELPEVAITALRAHRRRQTEERLYAGPLWPAEWDGLVFRTHKGTPLDPSNVRRIVAELATAAGIEGNVTPYDLRHTATTRLSEQGVAPELLADLLGHRDTRMVFKHYRHPVTPTISVAARHIEQALRAPGAT